MFAVIKTHNIALYQFHNLNRLKNMKKSFLLLPLIAVGAYFTLSSNSTGYVTSNRTGAGGSTVGCGDAGCHGTSASPSTLAVMGIAVDSAGMPVTHYVAGKTYRVTLYGGALASANLHEFGFQLAAAKVTGGTQAGQFVAATLPSQASISTIGGFDIVRHNTPKPDSVTIAGSAYAVQVNWTAPATAGTGSVEFFGVINAVDGDNAATSGDKWNSANTTLTELIDHTAVGNVNSTVAVNAFPNPVVNALNLQLNGQDGVYGVKLFDMTGKVVAENKVTVNGATTSTVNMAGFANGVYQVVVEKDGVSKVIAVVKQ